MESGRVSVVSVATSFAGCACWRVCRIWSDRLLIGRAGSLPIIWFRSLMPAMTAMKLGWTGCRPVPWPPSEPVASRAPRRRWD